MKDNRAISMKSIKITCAHTICLGWASIETEAETGILVQMTYWGNVLRRNLPGSKRSRVAGEGARTRCGFRLVQAQPDPTMSSWVKIAWQRLSCPETRRLGCYTHTSVSHWPRAVPRRVCNFHDICGPGSNCQLTAVCQKRKQVWVFSSQYLQWLGNVYASPIKGIWARHQQHLPSVDPAIPYLVMYPHIHLQTCKVIHVQVYSLQHCL